MAMFSQMSKLTDYLYLSGVMAITDNKLRLNNITNILNITMEVPGRKMPGIDCLTVQVDDLPTANLSVHFDRCADYINRVKQRGGKVLVHCMAGVSRSASICLAYFLKYRHMTLKESHDFVKSIRFVIRPNPGFWRQLIAYEKKLFGKTSVTMIKSPIGWIPDLYRDQVKGMVGFTGSGHPSWMSGKTTR